MARRPHSSVSKLCLVIGIFSTSLATPAWSDDPELRAGESFEQFARSWIDSVNELGVPCFSGSCPEIYNEKAFDQDNLRPKTPLVNAQTLGPASLAFLVHPTLTSEDLDRMCGVLGTILDKATIS